MKLKIVGSGGMFQTPVLFVIAPSARRPESKGVGMSG